MKKMLHFVGRTILMVTGVVLALSTTSCKREKYDYERVEGDALQTRMYTLDNGLKIFMTVNPEQPRIQTYIAVHAGSKHEPAETTGLAHYLEHMMFKGSTHFGTTDYEAEKVLLDQIKDLYETYRHTTDAEQRRAIYHQIDSISYAASSYFIPNEYDKLMAHIGSEGSNAFTSYDQTVYVEDIPNNQIENWARVQSDRLKNLVLRGFHTELEAVYEEFNKGLNSDWDHLSEALFGTLTPGHPYSHSVIGFGDHLKNPSIVNIENFFHTYYVPNNMAICLSGDFDPDEMVDILQKYFGDMEPNKELEQPHYDPIPELTEPVVREVLTPNPEMLVMGWRFDGMNSLQNDTLQLMMQVLSNGTAGLLDLDLNLGQKTLGAGIEDVSLCDYTALLMLGMPLPGQSLDEVRSLLCQEVEKLRKGQFDDALIPSIITQMKLDRQQQLEDNSSRAMAYVDAFTNDIPWDQMAGQLDRIAALTKEDVVRFASQHMRDNYVAVYKRQGTDPSIHPVEKPAITPIQMNRDSVSQFAQEILATEVAPIQPRFVDFGKDMSISDGDIRTLYTHNDLNDLFQMTLVYDMGTAANRYLPLAADYLNFLGTDSLSAEQVQQRFYQLGCEYNIFSDMRRTTITLSGLQENMPQAAALLQQVLSQCRVDSTVFQSLVSNEIQSRMNTLASFDSYARYLRTYLMYGLPGVELQLTNAEVMSADPQQLVDCIHGLLTTQHQVLYYGPAKKDEVEKLLADVFAIDGEYTPAPQTEIPALLLPTSDACYVIPYAGTQSFVMCQYAGVNNPWSIESQGPIAMYNEYFGGGMNTVVFQEMREKRSLCYGAGAMYRTPSYRDEHETFLTNIQSQNDKLSDCITVFDDIVNNMPASKHSFQVSKQGLMTQLRTARTTRMGILWTYLQAQEMGLDHDPAKDVFDQVEKFTLEDLVQFQQSHVRGLHYRSGFAGDPAGLSQQELERLGNVAILTPHDVFGF